MRLRRALPEDALALVAVVQAGFESYRAFAPPGWEPPSERPPTFQSTPQSPHPRPVWLYEQPPVVVHAPAPAKPNDHHTLVVCGYVFAVIMPLIGFILGIIAIAKGRTGHGVAHMAIAVVAWIIIAAALASIGAEPTYYDPAYDPYAI